MKKSLLNEERAGARQSSVSETGHAKNVANFETEIIFCLGFGPQYNPSNSLLSITSLQAKWDAAKQRLQNVKDTKEPFNSLVGQRQLAFEIVRPLATRIINALIAQNAPQKAIIDARAIIRKLNGKKASAPPGDDPDRTTISVSQQSYDRLIDHFAQLIVLAQTEPSYVPNEEELRISSLQDVLAELMTLNTRVKNAYVAYNNAILARDAELYSRHTGLLEIAIEVKNYVKSLFGAASPQYRQISGIHFQSVKA